MRVLFMENNMSSQCNSSHNVTFFYKLVEKEIRENWTTRDSLLLGLGLPFSLIVVLANLLVMVAIVLNHRFHLPIYYLLGNMAAADLFAGLAYANLILNTGPWTRRLSKTQWYIRSALVDISLTSSVANLLAVAFERHQTIITMQLHSTMSKRRVLLLIVSIWVAGIIMGLVPSLFWNCECDHNDCSTIAPLYSRRFLIFWAGLNLLTFFIMVIMYSRIFFYVKCQNRNVSPHTMEERQQTVINLMKTISMVLGAFVICWTPGLITLLVDGLLGKNSNAKKYEKYCLVIAECNSLVNPIIYSLRDVEMRKTFKWILSCLCRKGDCRQRESLPTDTGSQLTEKTLTTLHTYMLEDQVLLEPEDTKR
uniref:Lysophosphatidic acid receptor 2a n=2 Tax=Cyprinodon variegatus TaxID=28743 RepID=A0A3Q2C673_CYPVA